MTLFQDNSASVFLFPGIGVRPFGKEQLFFSKYKSIMEPYLLKGSQVAGVDLSSSLLDGVVFENPQFAREIFAYAFSHGTYRVFAEKGVQPRLMAGHSLGIYAAMSSCGAISFDDGLAMIERAHRLGRQYSGANNFGVAVLIGLDPDTVISFVKNKGFDSVTLANLNSESSGVYVGYLNEIDQLLCWAEKEGALKVIKLKIDIPFHSTLFMKDASRDFKKFVATLSWKTPACPILSSLDHTLLSTKEELIEMTAENLSCTIYWPDVMKILVKMGIDYVIECGAGVSLTQHSRFIECAPRHYNLKNMRRRLNY